MGKIKRVEDLLIEMKKNGVGQSATGLGNTLDEMEEVARARNRMLLKRRD